MTPRTRLGRLSPARRRFWLAVTGLLGAVLAAIVVPQVVAAVDAPGPTRVSQERLGPVLLVPGYGGSTSSLDLLARTLAEVGRQVQVVTLPDGGTGDLAAQARALGSQVDRALAASGAPSVDVIGYSAGGVVARLWAADDGGAAQARRIVTISSPHHGTEVAGLAAGVAPAACPTACRQLAPDSDLLRRLDAGDETPAGPLWAALWTTADRTVVPPDSGRLDGAVDFSVQSVCPDLGAVTHGDMPRTPAVIRMVLAQVGTPPPAVPGPAVCG